MLFFFWLELFGSKGDGGELRKKEEWAEEVSSVEGFYTLIFFYFWHAFPHIRIESL